MISPRYNPFHEHNVVIRVWGTTFKPALKKECERLGVKIYDRVMATSLLTEKGVPGKRVIGATGINSRTGEFLVFNSKATILSMSGAGYIWFLNTELAGYSTMHPRSISGDGIVMAWKAGAELTMMEKNSVTRIAGGYKHKWYTGAGDASYENVPLVDANGKKLPLINEPHWGVKPELSDLGGMRGLWGKVRQGLFTGEYALPIYGDFPAMRKIERDVTWNLMLGQESTTGIITSTFNKAGFDPAKDLLQAYNLLEGDSPPQWREAGYGAGLMVDWDLKTNLDGLYAAGTQIFSPRDHSFAAATGRYAGRKASEYAKQVGISEISSEQVAAERARVYSPIKRDDGIDWKELHAGIARAMQFYCSEYKTELLLNMGMDTLKEIEEKWVPKLYAIDPHKLVRSLEDLSMLTNAQIILHASLARKASSKPLDFQRLDYPQLDPPEWNKFLIVKLENGKVKVDEKPLDYAGNLKQNYEAHNKDYKGVYKG